VSGIDWASTFLDIRRDRGEMKSLLQLYARYSVLVSYLQSPFLLAVRLYWGWQFAQSGWGKLHHLDKITSFFTKLNIPFPALNAHFISGLEFVGGILLIVGLGARLTGLLLTGNMLVAYWTADREALFSIFSDPGKFYVADPYTFLFASAMVVLFGAGLFSVDALLVKRCRAWIERQ
jgi:putative oxidoreductase